MNAQEKVLEYAKQHNHTNGRMTDQQVAGQMFTEGFVVSRDPDKVTAKIIREGRTIIVVETTTRELAEMVNGKVVTEVTTVEIFRAEI